MKTTKMLTILVLVAAAAVLVGPGQEASGGTLAAWGNNGSGQCDVPAGDDFAAVAAGGYHSLALKSDGSLAAWGYNSYGLCDVPAGNNFAAIAAGRFHSLALKSDGSLAAWGISHGGSGDYGQVTDTPAGNDFVAVAAGRMHSVALKSDGSLAAWGISDGGTLDYGQVTDTPVGNDFVAIAAGTYHSLALKSDGSLAAWGNNGSGQCDVPEGNTFLAIAAGSSHSLALKSDGSLAAWGRNSEGQCDVPAGNDFAAIAAGGYHSLALKSDGSLAAWGNNGSGQCDVPEYNTFLAIAGGGSHSLAIVTEPIPMGTAFTYQGGLLDEGSPAEGLYDFEFSLFNANVAGTQGSTIDINDIDVIDGSFTVELDFGSDVFNGDARWLQVGVRPGGSNDPNAFVTLSPRTELTPTPYAIYAETASNVETAGIPVPLKLEGAIGNVSVIEARNSVLYPLEWPYSGTTIQITSSFEAAHAHPDGWSSFGVKGSDVATTTDPYWPCLPYPWNERYGYGGYFTSESEPGCDCSGEMQACTSGYGVYGKATGANYNYGVYGEAEGYSGYGVYGKNTGGYGYGVYGETRGGYGYAVYGMASGTNAFAGYFYGRGYFKRNVGIGTENPNEKLTVAGALSLGKMSAPSASAGYGKLYVKSTDGELYFINDAGTEYELTAGEDDFVAGNFLICANDTDRGHNATGPYPLKETKIGRGGSLTIKFDLRATSPSYPVYAYICRNGTPVGTIRFANSTAYVTYSEDISGWSKGDLVQVFGYTSNPTYAVVVRNFRLYVDNPAEAGARL